MFLIYACDLQVVESVSIVQQAGKRYVLFTAPYTYVYLGRIFVARYLVPGVVAALFLLLSSFSLLFAALAVVIIAQTQTQSPTTLTKTS